MIRVGTAVEVRQFFREHLRIEWQRLDYLLSVIIEVIVAVTFKMV